RNEPALHLATDRSNGSGSQNSLMGAAGPDQHVYFTLGSGGRDGSGQVTGREHLDAGARLADFRNELFVARPIENRDAQILNVDLLRLGQRFEVVSRRTVEVDDAPS